MTRRLPGGTQDPAQLAERGRATRVVGLALDAVHLVVRADVLERRDEQHLVERPVRERQRPRIGDDRLEAGHLRRGEVGADELARVGLDESAM